jgi:L-alanine-DL-glutamate epimerase-like enolase superfamily enzyme
LDIIQPDISFCGGITTAWDVMHLASASFIRTALHMGGSFGPAYAAGLHVSFAHRDAIILETLPVALPTIREVIQYPLELVDGTFGPPPDDLPGLGVEIDEAFLARHPFVPGSGERG